jgi:hypothetical protein
VIVQVLVTERDAEHALPDERGDRVLDEPRVSCIAETSRKPANEIEVSVRRAREQAALQPVQTGSVLRYTASASGHCSGRAQVVVTKQLLPDSAARCASKCERCGLIPAVMTADRHEPDPHIPVDITLWLRARP